MKRTLTTIAVVLLAGCGKGYVLEYAQTAARFLGKDVAAKTKAYNNKIGIKMKRRKLYD